jgi:choline kinase
MKAIILAAGRGSRMKEFTADRPKGLVELRGKSLIDWQIRALLDGGVNDIGIVTGYKRELFADRKLTEFYNAQWAITNMVSSLACATEWLESSECIVSYSDIFYEPSAVESLVGIDVPLAVTYDPNWLGLWKRRFADPLSDAETFRLNADGTLAEIGKKPMSVDDVQGQYMGLLRFNPFGWSEVQRCRDALLPTVRDTIHMTDTLQMVIDSSRLPIAAIPYAGAWGEIDTIEDLALYKTNG